MLLLITSFFYMYFYIDRSLTSLHSLNVFLILSIDSIRKYTIPCIYTQKKGSFRFLFFLGKYYMLLSSYCLLNTGELNFYTTIWSKTFNKLLTILDTITFRTSNWSGLTITFSTNYRLINTVSNEFFNY